LFITKGDEGMRGERIKEKKQNVLFSGLDFLAFDLPTGRDW
jgi:hypothetical protein